MKRYQIFLNNKWDGETDEFPRQPLWHACCVVYDRGDRSDRYQKEKWWLMDATPLHIDSVPKETRVAALLLGIA